MRSTEQIDLEAGIELSKEEMERQLYKPVEAIEHLDVEDLLSDSLRLTKGLDSMKVDEMMLVRDKDKTNFYSWKRKHPRKKFISKSVGLPVVVDQIFDLADLLFPQPSKKGYIVVKRIA